MSHPRKQEVLEAIRKHLVEHGPRKWNLIYEQFPEIRPSTLYGWAKQIRMEPAPSLPEAERRILQRVRGAIIERELEAERNGTAEIARHLPAAPPPSYIAQTGERGLRQIDFVGEIKKLYRDAEMLRAYAVAVTRDEEGNETEKIKNPNTFDRSIARRANLLETAIKAVEEIWNLRTMQMFYEVVIDEIGKADPDTQKRILERLAALNASTGMTLSATRL